MSLNGIPERYTEIYRNLHNERCNFSLRAFENSIERLTTYSKLYSSRFFSIPLKYAKIIFEKLGEVQRGIFEEQPDFEFLTALANDIQRIHMKKYNALSREAEQFYPYGFRKENLVHIYQLWEIIDRNDMTEYVDECEDTPLLIHDQFMEIFQIECVNIFARNADVPGVEEYWFEEDDDEVRPLRCIPPSPSYHLKTKQSISVTSSVESLEEEVEYLPIEKGEFEEFEEFVKSRYTGTKEAQTEEESGNSLSKPQ